MEWPPQRDAPAACSLHAALTGAVDGPSPPVSSHPGEPANTSTEGAERDADKSQKVQRQEGRWRWRPGGLGVGNPHFLRWLETSSLKRWHLAEVGGRGAQSWAGVSWGGGFWLPKRTLFFCVSSWDSFPSDVALCVPLKVP